MPAYDDAYKRRVLEERARRRNLPPPVFHEEPEEEIPEILHSESPSLPPDEPEPPVRRFRDTGGAG